MNGSECGLKMQAEIYWSIHMADFLSFFLFWGGFCAFIFWQDTDEETGRRGEREEMTHSKGPQGGIEPMAIVFYFGNGYTAS